MQLTQMLGLCKAQLVLGDFQVIKVFKDLQVTKDSKGSQVIKEFMETPGTKALKV